MLMNPEEVEEYIFNKYLPKARSAKTHPAKLLVISELFKDVFGIEVEELLPGIEKKVKSKILGVRGSMDLSFTNVVIEIKTNIGRELEEGKKELKKYFQALIEEDPTRKYTGIITDGIVFKAYVPILLGNTVLDVELTDKERGEIDLSKVPPMEAILWLDSFIFSSETLQPKAEDLRRRFGPGSVAYHSTRRALKDAWKIVKNKKDVKLKLDLWQKNMEIVYGSTPEEEAFLSHTYLVTLVKIILALRFSNRYIPREEFEKVLSGEYLSRYANIVEEDFFTWILEPEVKDKVADAFYEVAKALAKYDLKNVDEDFFKEIYEEIVERSQRHRLGEYYTPEWLAELTIKEALQYFNNTEKIPKILDPACGSGTFLQGAIKILKRKLEGKENALETILRSVVGVDINPLAIIIARANYILALGELLKAGINVPVFLADSIKIPKPEREIYHNVPCLKYKVDKEHVILVPLRVARNRHLLAPVLSALRSAITEYRKGGVKKMGARAMLRRELETIDIKDHERAIILDTLNVLIDLVDKGLDGIWVFMLNNIYAPIALQTDKFDIIVGNPPWIALRYIENKDYQDFIKKEVLDYGLLDSSDVKLFTHMEMATLFFMKTADLYLRENGVIAFVMPRSVLTGAKHHQKFQEFKKPQMRLLKILDFEDISPLFNVPSTVLIAKKGEKTEYPVTSISYRGKLPRKNMKLEEAIKYLDSKEEKYSPPRIGGKKSYYYDKFLEGATLVPRNFWFVEFEVNPELGGVNPKTPTVRTSREIIKTAKPPWKDIILKGEVENEFLYWTVLGGDIYPFSFTPRLVVLPAQPKRNSYRILDVEDLRNEGYPKMARWLEKAQEYWEKYATEKSRSNMPRVIQRLDYQKLLTSQNPNAKYYVLYNGSGKHLASCVISKNNPVTFNVDKIQFRIPFFIAESKSYYYSTNNEDEANYLSAILNSDVVNDLIKDLQTKGSFGERDIHRRPLELPVPKFDPNNEIHIQLAELSKRAHEKMKNFKFKAKSAGRRRKEAREVLKEEIEKINELVKEILGI